MFFITVQEDVSLGILLEVRACFDCSHVALVALVILVVLDDFGEVGVHIFIVIRISFIYFITVIDFWMLNSKECYSRAYGSMID